MDEDEHLLEFFFCIEIFFISKPPLPLLNVYQILALFKKNNDKI